MRSACARLDSARFCSSSARLASISWLRDTIAAIQSGTIGFSFTEEDDINGLYARGTTTAFPTSAAVTVGQTFLVNGAILRVTVAGTTAGTVPTLPGAVGGTVTDGTVTWKRVS